MVTSDQQKAHQELLKKLDYLTFVLETLTVVSAVAAGMPSTKIRKILKMKQARVSDISQGITGRASPTPGKKPEIK